MCLSTELTGQHTPTELSGQHTPTELTGQHTPTELSLVYTHNTHENLITRVRKKGNKISVF
jgi:hypothetical protein